MVVLKNIKKNKNIVECDYYPENGEIFRHMKVNTDTGDIVEDTRKENEMFMAVPHVRRTLASFKNEQSIPKEKTIMWY